MAPNEFREIEGSFVVPIPVKRTQVAHGWKDTCIQQSNDQTVFKGSNNCL